MLLVQVSSFLDLIWASISDCFFHYWNMTDLILSHQSVWLHLDLSAKLASFVGFRHMTLGEGKSDHFAKASCINSNCAGG